MFVTYGGGANTHSAVRAERPSSSTGSVPTSELYGSELTGS